MRTSEAISSLIKYVEDNQEQDPLVIDFDDLSRRNPFKRERINKCSMM